MRRNVFENRLLANLNDFNTAIVDGKFPVSGSFLDLTDAQRVIFFIKAGTLDSAITVQVQQDTSATQTASIKSVTGAVDIVGAGDDDKLFVIELEVAKLDIGNGFRYVTLDITGAAGGNDYLSMMAERSPVRHAPVTQPADIEFVRVAG